MKTFQTIIFLLISTLLFSQGAQRMAILPKSMKSALIKSTGRQIDEIPSLCVDYFRDPPTSIDTYSTILHSTKTDSRLKPLKKLEGKYTIEGMNSTSGMILKHSKSNERITDLNNDSPFILGKPEDDPLDSRYLEFVESTIAEYNNLQFNPERHEELQHRIWEYDILAKLKLLSNNPNPFEAFIEGKARFQSLFPNESLFDVAFDYKLYKHDYELEINDPVKVIKEVREEYRQRELEFEREMELYRLEQEEFRIEKSKLEQDKNALFSEDSDNFSKIFKVGEELVQYDEFLGVLSRQKIGSNEVRQMEQHHFNQAQFLSSLDENIEYLAFSSINRNTNELVYTLGATEYSLKLETNGFNSFISDLKLKVSKLPNNVSVVVSRNQLQMGLEQMDKTTLKNRTSDRILEQSFFTEYEWLNHTEIARELTRSVPNRVVLSSTKYADLDRLSEVPRISSGKDIVAYVAPESFGVQSDQIKVLSKNLSKSDIQVVEASNLDDLTANLTRSNALIISAHKNVDFERYLSELAQNGLLENKVVAVFSCFEQGTTSLNSTLIEMGRAKQILFFPSQINVDATKAVISEITILLEQKGNSISFTLEELIKNAIESSLIKYPDLRLELEELKDILPQISMLNNQTNQNNG